ncbi:hypothetical protein CDD83_10524 [Cordyceps sp. RAO-2017]|nr:hypothetical protein CDD83_10524 [Cordyceps sp. RAO-2017]
MRQDATSERERDGVLEAYESLDVDCKLAGLGRTPSSIFPAARPPSGRQEGQGRARKRGGRRRGQRVPAPALPRLVLRRRDWHRLAPRNPFHKGGVGKPSRAAMASSPGGHEAATGTEPMPCDDSSFSFLFVPETLALLSLPSAAPPPP